MQDTDIEAIYKANINISHAAALRGVYDAGYAAGLGTPNVQTTGDVSQSQAAPTVDPVVEQP